MRFLRDVEERLPFRARFVRIVASIEQRPHAVAVGADAGSFEQTIAVVPEMRDVQQELALAHSRMFEAVDLARGEQLPLDGQYINQRLDADALGAYRSGQGAG